MKNSLIRLWKFLPGFFAWSTIIGLTILAFTAPQYLAITVLVYAIYWFLKVIIIAGHLVVGFIRYRVEVRIDWYKKLQQEQLGTFESYYQLAVVPTYKEDISILRQTLDAIKNSNYLTKRLLVVVAFEERDKENAKHYAAILTHEYEHVFGHFFATFHPSDIAGEVKGKGPNITWAAREVKKWIDQEKIDYEKVIVTTLDADNRVDQNYFANLMWTYLNTDDPVHKSFQPLPMFFNNIWKVPFAVKVTAIGSSFWQMVQAMRPHYCRNFSAHAQSLEALVQTDFWSTTTIVEDGHQFWRSYFKFDGNHYVVPVFVPVYMDAVEGENLLQSFREQYLQRRRWFWGVSDIPYVFEHSYGNKKIPFFYKWAQFVRLVESHYSLVTQSFILLIGWLPVSLNADFRNTVLGFSFPTIYHTFLTAAWVGFIVNMAIVTLLVPPRPGKRSTYFLSIVWEWLLAPVMWTLSSIIFSALPAIDSQTRLMFNKPFTVFNVTKKVAVESGIVRVSSN